MTIRRRLFILYVSLFTVVMIGVSISIYLIYSEFREEVFYERLNQRIRITTKLLFKSQTIDTYLAQAIDTVTIDNQHEEKLIIFDADNRIVYSSIDDAPLAYSPTLLADIRSQRELRTVSDDVETLGLCYVHNGTEYVALASAVDVTGRHMIENLVISLLVASGVGLILILGSSRFFIRKTLQPIVDLRKQIDGIGPDTLNKRVRVEPTNDELESIATSFNITLEQLEHAFDFQRHFVHYASHELNTPISVTHAIVERLRTTTPTIEEYRTSLDDLWDVQQRLAQLLYSLLLLSSLDSASLNASKRSVRIDELFFSVIEEFVALYPDVKFNVDVDSDITDQSQVTVFGIEPLLRTALNNLLENAAKYTTAPYVHCSITSTLTAVEASITNPGEPIAESERHLIFEPFFRPLRATERKGKGLGLPIVQRIARLHGGSVTYTYDPKQGNVFTISLQRTAVS